MYMMKTRSMTQAEEAAKNFKVGKDPWETNASRDIGEWEGILEMNTIVNLPRILAEEDMDPQTRQLKEDEGEKILACVGCHKALITGSERVDTVTSLVPTQPTVFADRIQSSSAAGVIWGSPSTHVPVFHGFERCIKCHWPICKVNCPKEFHPKIECDMLTRLHSSAMKVEKCLPINVEPEAAYLLLSIVRVCLLKRSNLKSFQDFMVLEYLPLYDDEEQLLQLLNTWGWYLKPLRLKANEGWEILARVIGYRLNLREVSSKRWDYGVFPRKFNVCCQPNTKLTIEGNHLTQKSIIWIADGDLLTVGRRDWLLSPAHTRNLHARLLPPHDKFSLLNDRVCPCAICSDATPNTDRDQIYGQICRRCEGQMIPVVERRAKKQGQTYLNFKLKCVNCENSIPHFEFKKLELQGWIETISSANNVMELSNRIEGNKYALRNHHQLARILRAIAMSGEYSFSEPNLELRNSYWIETIENYNAFCPGRAGDFWPTFLKSHQRIEGVDSLEAPKESQRRLREASRNAGKLGDTMKHTEEGLQRRSNSLLAVSAIE